MQPLNAEQIVCPPRVALEINLTVSYGGVLRVQDARFLQGSDAGVDQLQACRQFLLDVLLAVYVHTGKRRVTHESVEKNNTCFGQ